MNIWYEGCATTPRLLKQEAGSWVPLVDERPREGSLLAYYLDGVYVENRSLGCDGGNSCYPRQGRLVDIESTLEYVAEDTDPSDADATEPMLAPRFVSRPTQGPYAFEVRYMTRCVGEVQSKILLLP